MYFELSFLSRVSITSVIRRMNDDDGPKVATEVYQQLFSEKEGVLDPDTVAYALDDAVQALRRSKLPISRWAPFIHLGV